MRIEQTISSCRAVFDYASNSLLLQSLLIVLVVTVPVVKIMASVLKTRKKTKDIEKHCYSRIPQKLERILTFRHLPKELFLISTEKRFTAVSIGFFSKKIVLSKYLISKVSAKELEAIVLHEVYHANHNHAILLFFAQLWTNIFFFLPFFKDIEEYIKFKLEKSADEYAVLLQHTVKHVKSSLRKALTVDDAFSLFPKFSYQVIDQRIDSLNAQKTKLKFSLKRLGLSLLVLFVLFGLALVSNTQSMVIAVEEKVCRYKLIEMPVMSEAQYSVDTSSK